MAMIFSLDDLLALSPGEFEDAVADLLEGQGYRDVRRVGGAGDAGIDIFCVDEEGNRVAVQCKRYAPTRTIGSPVLQAFYGAVIRHRVHRSLYVTTSGFTTAARNLAVECDIELIDGPELVKQFISHARDRPGPELVRQDNQARVASSSQWTCPYCLSSMKATERRCSGCLRYR